MTDFKQLCRELVWLDQAEPGDYADWRYAWNAAIKRARAALAEPEPPSLKEQALEALCHLDKGAQSQMDTTEAAYIIRRALESLPS